MIAPPPGHLRLVHGGVLRTLLPDDATAVAAAVRSSLDHLRPWMPWADERSSDPSFQRARIGGLADLAARNVEWQYGLFVEGDFFGSFGLMTRRGPGTLEIGYWLRADATGSGWATRAVAALAATGAAVAGVDELWIVCDEANERSAAVARRCGFTLRRVEERAPECPGETGRLLIFIRPAAEVP